MNINSVINVSQSDEKWMYQPERRPQARLRLFCFPYAGGAAPIFRPWPQSLSEDIEVMALRLPGKELRLREQPYRSVDEVIANIVPALRPLLDKPFALFGHSMGATLAYELSKVLINDDIKPQHLFISACRSPITPRRKKTMHNMPHNEFRSVLQKMNGTPQTILNDDELFALLEPGLRADLEVIEKWGYSSVPPINVPISVFYGENDQEVFPGEVQGWKQVTNEACRLHRIDGDHFFMHSHEEVMLKVIQQALIAD